MYIYKFTITFISGHTRDEWMTADHDETVSQLKDRADMYMSELEADTSIKSVQMRRRLVPGI